MYNFILRTIGNVYLLYGRAIRRILYHVMKSRFKYCGKKLNFCPESSDFTYETISLGDDVHIGPKAFFMSTESEIIIGNHVMFAPKVTIIGGNHNTSVVGSYMRSVRNKTPVDDEPVIIEDDVWIGTNSTILKGVTIGRGSIVAAGSVVTNSIPPYSIVGGAAARLIRWGWPLEIILKHESLLYREEDRIDKKKLIYDRENYKKNHPMLINYNVTQ